VHGHILFFTIRGKSYIGNLLSIFSINSYSTELNLPLADLNRFSQFSHIFAEKLFRKKHKRKFYFQQAASGGHKKCAVLQHAMTCVGNEKNSATM
jgi:hypothetical protein